MLPKNVEENALAVLLFSEDCLPLSTMLRTEHFITEHYKIIAAHALNYIEIYQKAPDVHIADLLIEETEKYPEIKESLIQIKRLAPKVHLDFIMDEIRFLVRRYNLRASLTKAVQALQGNDLDGVDHALEESRKNELAIFDAGINFGNIDEIYDSLHKKEPPVISTGIEVLDKLRIGMQKGTLFLLMAASGRGKSWGLTHLGKEALFDGRTVLHITLENSRELTLRRYIQSILGVSKHDATYLTQYTSIKKDEAGAVVELDFLEKEVDGIKSYSKEQLKDRLGKNFGRYAKNLWIKKFPNGYLTFNELRNYITAMAKNYNFIPDVVVIDYVECMNIDTDNLRIDTGALFKKLHGLSEHMGFALVTASQSNRQSFDAKKVKASHASEDISKIMVSDVVLTYSQTDFEKSRGLARINIEKARDAVMGTEFLITQNYEIGSFCLDSAFLGNRYAEIVP